MGNGRWFLFLGPRMKEDIFKILESSVSCGLAMASLSFLSTHISKGRHCSSMQFRITNLKHNAVLIQVVLFPASEAFFQNYL